MDELDATATQRITRSYPTSLGDIRDDLKKQILLNHTGSRMSYNQIPLVHGRSVGARLDSNATNAASAATNGAAVCGTTANKGTGRAAAGGRTRMANHQRNLSLDFRSMGIVLPPVSQVTNTRVNLTQHHRNRSLDSALQGIPEVRKCSIVEVITIRRGKCVLLFCLYLVFTTHTHSRMNMTFDKFANDHLDRFVLPNWVTWLRCGSNRWL